MTKRLEPCGYSKAWACDCPKCQAFWDQEYELEIADSTIEAKLLEGQEFDDELEQDLAQTFEVDGWMEND